MQKCDGAVNVNGTLAYAPQQAWIQNMSLRDNVLFAKPMNDERYNKILDACALRPDLAILPGGDKTEIGERGINLSGGQKQRVSLARAVYQDADIYLLDDTLSAVDAHVGKHIFSNVIGPEGLLKNKTRILVTHGIGFLSKMDEIIVIKNGVISEHGTYEELLGHNGPFAEFINSYLHESNHDDDAVDEEEVIKLERRLSIVMSQTSDSESVRSRKSSAASAVTDNSHRLRRRQRRKSSEAAEEPDSKKTPSVINRRLIEEEVAEEGAVKLSVIKSYLSAATPVYPVTAAVSLVCFVAAQVCTNIWLSKWTQQPVINGTQDRHETDLYLGVYGGLGGAQTFAVFGLALSVSLGSMVASRNLHGGLLRGVLRCPMSFFDTTPLGRIVNRFSKDVDILDSNIPQFTQNLLITFAPLCSTIIVITYSTPIFITVIIPLIIIFVIIQRVYVSCARQIKRIDSIRRSPMYAFFSETLNGTSSIRAYSQEQRFIDHSDLLLDNSQRVWFEAFSSNRWIGVWSEFIGDLIIFFTAIFAVLQKDTLNPGLVGLSLSFALQVNMNIVLTVRSSCELETYILAVERIKEYTELPSEASWTSKDHIVPRDWPADGVIEFKDYSTRYRPGLDLVLKGISCRVQSGEKVGIVGRTGAGKSSMTLALFRIVEPSTGSIEIDGCNICVVGLHDLRKKLTVIAQDPVLFSGTLRFNLDPSESFTNTEVWRALEHAHLKAFVETLPDNIYHECGEDGKNLSVGQRQLVCLARALLRKSKILVLDEATAAVDLETDDLIQSTIRTEFADCTVLTIAHRLNTVMDYDRVMVLQNGEIREFESPSTLLANSQSQFYSMARDAGLV
jgi:ABC-type multidrug transport system fused ATPase/permease subunit